VCSSDLGGEGNDGQTAAIEAIRERCLFDGLFHESMVMVASESEAPMIARIDAASGGAVICVGSNDEWFPIGASRPDGQPSVWERRWLVERKQDSAGNKKTKTYLRVERHRMIGDGAVIDQEAYEGRYVETLSALGELKRVPLAQAFEPGMEVPEEFTATGLSRLPIVQLVRYRSEGEPCPMLSRDDLDIVDTCAAAFSRIARALELHGNAMLKVGEGMLNDDGTLKSEELEVVVDPENEIGYIIPEYQFEHLLKWLDRVCEWMLVGPLSMSPSLLGMKIGGGAVPDSFDKLRLESTNTLSVAMRAVPYITQALGRVMTTATEMESALPLRGFSVSPVSATISPEIPRDDQQRSRDVGERMDRGLISLASALVELYGAERGEIELAQINEERDAAASRNRQELFGAIGSDDGADPIGDPDQADSLDQVDINDDIEQVAKIGASRIADTAYTGIQIDKLIEIAGLVRFGQIEIETAIKLVSIAFLIEESRARDILSGEVGKSSPVPAAGGATP